MIDIDKFSTEQYEIATRIPQWFLLDRGFHNFWWELQPSAQPIITRFLKDWLDWKYRPLNTPDYLKPQPFLFVDGPANIGKTEFLARGIGRFFAFNIRLHSMEYVNWPSYVKDQLNGGKMKVNWDASLLILDDLDRGIRPIPKSLDTWLVEHLSTLLKFHRGQSFNARPTIIITNKGSNEELILFFSTNSLKKESKYTVEAAKQVMSVLHRYKHSKVELSPVPSKYEKYTTADLCKRAIKTNDMNPFLEILTPYPYLKNEVVW